MRDGCNKSGGSKAGTFNGTWKNLWSTANTYNSSEVDQHSRLQTTGKKNIAVTAIGRRGKKAVGKR